MTVRLSLIVIAIFALLGALASCRDWYFGPNRTRYVSGPAVPQAQAAASAIPLARPAHVVIVVEENKSFSQIIGNVAQAPYLNELARHGAVFTQSYAIAHPSQPNYFALFAGRTNPNGDDCAVRGIAPDAENLGADLLAAGRSFVAYAEDLPRPGYRGCLAGHYERKHAPWAYFVTIPDASIQPLSALPDRWERLPTLSFVIANDLNEMHSGSIRRADTWLRRTLGPLITWAGSHDTLIVITWDEGSEPFTNHIPTLFVGPMVAPGRYDEVVNHYRVLRTIEDLYGLPHLGAAASVAPIADTWRRAPSRLRKNPTAPSLTRPFRRILRRSSVTTLRRCSLIAPRLGETFGHKSGTGGSSAAC